MQQVSIGNHGFLGDLSKTAGPKRWLVAQAREKVFTLLKLKTLTCFVCHPEGALATEGSSKQGRDWHTCKIRTLCHDSVLRLIAAPSLWQFLRSLRLPQDDSVFSLNVLLTTRHIATPTRRSSFPVVAFFVHSEFVSIWLAE